MDLKPRPNYRRYLEVLRAITPQQRLNKAFELTELSRKLFRIGLRLRFPELSETAGALREAAPRMSQSELLKRTASALQDLDVPFMLTGSLASSLQRQPRSTHDIYLVIDASVGRIMDLPQVFPPPE